MKERYYARQIDASGRKQVTMSRENTPIAKTVGIATILIVAGYFVHLYFWHHNNKASKQSAYSSSTPRLDDSETDVLSPSLSPGVEAYIPSHLPSKLVPSDYKTVDAAEILVTYVPKTSFGQAALSERAATAKAETARAKALALAQRSHDCEVEKRSECLICQTACEVAELWIAARFDEDLSDEANPERRLEALAITLNDTFVVGSVDGRAPADSLRGVPLPPPRSPGIEETREEGQVQRQAIYKGAVNVLTQLLKNERSKRRVGLVPDKSTFGSVGIEIELAVLERFWEGDLTEESRTKARAILLSLAAPKDS